LTVLNGAEGLSELASGLVAQGKAIFDTLHGGVIDYGDDYDDGHSAAPVDGNSAYRSSQQPTR
jgi:flotillin